MLQVRRTALRLLASSPSTFVPKPRNHTSLSTAFQRLPRQSTCVSFQRRWASGEAEAQKAEATEEAPISQLQPTPQEEVENAIHSDNAAGDVSQSAAEPRVAEEQRSSLGSAVNAASEAASSAATTIQQAASATVNRAAEATGYSSRAPMNPDPKPTIYIGNLFFDVTENDLVKELARFGTIVRCRLMRDSRGLSKGFGYIDFDNTASATKAVETLNQQLFEGRRLAVQYAAYETKDIENRARPDRANKPLNPPSKTLFIGNMSFEMTDRDLNEMFRGIRNVIDVRVAIDRRTGQPRGFAHADFVDIKSAMEAMKVLEGKETYGRKIRIDYSYGPSNSPRREGSETP